MTAPLNTSNLLQVDATAGPTTFNSTAIGFSLTAGRDVIFTMGAYSTTAHVSAVTIGGTAATRDVRVTSNANNAEVWHAFNIAGSNTDVVVTYTGASDNYISGKIQEYASGTFSGVDTACVNTATGTSAAPAVTMATATAQASEIVIAAAAADTGSGSIGYTDATTGYTAIFTEQNGSAHANGASSYKEETGVVTESASWTTGASVNWMAAIVGYKLSATGPTINTQPASTTKNSGDTATFNISATTSGGTLHYQWKVNGSNVGTDSNSYTTGTLGNSNQWDAITCVVTDDNGSTTSSTAVLTIAFAAAGTGPRRRNIIGAHPVGSLGWLGIASGSGTTDAAAYSAGLATGIAVGQSTVSANALSSAVSTALAIGAAITRADAFTQGASTAQGIGATLQSGDAFTQGTSSAIAVGTSSANSAADAYSAGVATDIATGQSTNAADAFTQGAATDIAAGQSTVAADAYTQGTSTAQAEGTTAGGGVTITADGYSAGASTAKAVGSGGLTGNTVITLGANPWMKNARAQQSAIDDENEEILQLLAQLVPQLSRGGSHHASR